MVQSYIFIIDLGLIIALLVRRKYLYKKQQKTRFQEKIARRVQELRANVHEEASERFKESYRKEQKNKKPDAGAYNLRIKKAEMAISKKQWTVAKRILIEAMALRNDLDAGLKLAMVYQNSNELNKAENLYRRLAESYPNHSEIYANLGHILTQKKRHKEAIKLYTRAVDLDEKNSDTLIDLGKLYALLTHYDSAVECFHRATLLRPREVEYLFLMAKAYQDGGNDQSALLTYEKLLTIEPYNEKAQEYAQDLRIKLNTRQ